MIARICESCNKIIEQSNNEFLHVWIQVRNALDNDEQDCAAQVYGDFCDTCVANGKAITTLVKALDWKLEPNE